MNKNPISPKTKRNVTSQHPHVQDLEIKSKHRLTGATTENRCKPKRKNQPTKQTNNNTEFCCRPFPSATRGGPLQVPSKRSSTASWTFAVPPVPSPRGAATAAWSPGEARPARTRLESEHTWTTGAGGFGTWSQHVTTTCYLVFTNFTLCFSGPMCVCFWVARRVVLLLFDESS